MGRGPPPPQAMRGPAPAAAPVDEDGVAGATRQLADRLLSSLFFCQSILNTMVVKVERSESKAERNHWRVAEYEAKLQDVRSEMAQLERALDAERNMRAYAVSDSSMQQMTRDELLAKCSSLSQSLYLEGQKLKDLEAKHQREHRNIVAANVAIQRYQKVQEALKHTRRALEEREGEFQRVGAFKSTIQSQEEVIGKLEHVVEKLAAENKQLKQEGFQTRRKLDEAVGQLRREMTVNESDMYAKLQSRITELWQQLEESQRQKSELQEQLQSEQMQKARAESRATALDDQIRELASRYSAEITSMRQQLIEKDAELAASRVDVGVYRDSPGPTRAPMGPAGRGREGPMFPRRGGPPLQGRGGPQGSPPGGPGGSQGPPPGGRGGPIGQPGRGGAPGRGPSGRGPPLGRGMGGPSGQGMPTPGRGRPPPE